MDGLADCVLFCFVDDADDDDGGDDDGDIYYYYYVQYLPGRAVHVDAVNGDEGGDGKCRGLKWNCDWLWLWQLAAAQKTEDGRNQRPRPQASRLSKQPAALPPPAAPPNPVPSSPVRSSPVLSRCCLLLSPRSAPASFAPVQSHRIASPARLPQRVSIRPSPTFPSTHSHHDLDRCQRTIHYFHPHPHPSRCAYPSGRCLLA